MADPAKGRAARDLRGSPTVESWGDAGGMSSQAFGDRGWLIGACGAVSLAETRAIERSAVRAAATGRRDIVLDLTGITDLRGGVLGGILRLRRGLGAIDGRLVLVVDGPPADALTRVSVIQLLVDVVSSVDDAAALLADGARDGRPPGP